MDEIIEQFIDEKRLTEQQFALYLNNRYKRTKKNIIALCATKYDSNSVFNMLNHINNNAEIYKSYDHELESDHMFFEYLESFSRIVENKSEIILTDVMSFVSEVPSIDYIKNNLIILKIGSEIAHEELENKLLSLNYNKVSKVYETADYAKRGYVFDIFPLNYENPVRLEFFDNEIISIDYFDINTQRKIGKLEELKIYPMNIEVEKKHTKFFEDFTDYEVIIYEEKAIDNQIKLILEQENKDYTKLIKESSYIIKQKSIENLVEYLPNDSDSKKIFLETKMEENYKIIISTVNKKIIKQLSEDFGFKINESKDVKENYINIISTDLIEGFIYKDFYIISEREYLNLNNNILNNRLKAKIGTKIENYKQLKINDYIVHEDYGIGKYLGIKSIDKNGINKDYLTLKYDKKNKLYIPIDNVKKLSKYDLKDAPKLSNFDSEEWHRKKSNAEKQIKEIAENLIKIYAKRETKKGIDFIKDETLEKEFDEDCKFKLTIDQEKALNEIKKDMESITPMDRILIGDVGFGKTEVAFRAIFKCVISSYQAMFLCPTTILSFQHYENALKRFKNFPLRIEVLNRFISKKKENEILKDLKEGKIDLLIGTQKILNENIKIKKLGLMIIDEEQRFGVSTKEKIKEYKSQIDMLTLSATPIPRTLQISFAGLKNISIIKTPPLNRYPIETYVVAENYSLIRKAIENEINRGGQTFLLYNNIREMDYIEKKIRDEIPNIRILKIHGQMEKNKIEKEMLNFTKGNYDVMLCTTIIETGIDIPMVNTLIVFDSHNFGLSQLYQLRGRVGRSNRQAYCYLLYKREENLTPIAKKRLDTIKEFTKLGSGFSVAMRDLNIRGGGDILGINQSGFMSSIGVDLFYQLLNREIKKIKNENVPELDYKNKILVDVSNNIPDEYIADDDIKLEVHKLITEINSQETYDSTKNELEDRFGRIPESLLIYMQNELLKTHFFKYNINKLDYKINEASITLTQELLDIINLQELFLISQRMSRYFRIKKIGKNIKLILNTKQLDVHYITIYLNLFKEIEETIQN